MLTLDCGGYPVNKGIFAVSRSAYCIVTKYKGLRESSHVRLKITLELVDSAVVSRGS